MANASRFRRIVLLIVLLALPTALMANWWHGSKHFRGRKYKAPPALATITVTVKSEQFKKPVNDAHVVFHSRRDNRPDGYMEMITNREGNAVITVIPVGDTLILQVLKRGYNTFGQTYKVNAAKKHITVMLQPPQPQFSDYRAKPTGQVGAGGKGTTTPQQEKKQDTSHSSNKKH